MLILAHRANQKVNLLQQHVPTGFIELQEKFVDAISGGCRDSAHMLTWRELK